MAALNATERRVLFLLAGDYASGRLWFTRGVARKLRIKQVCARRALRSMVRRGYARLDAAFAEYDGTLAGSGYGCTNEGWEATRSMLEA